MTTLVISIIVLKIKPTKHRFIHYLALYGGLSFKIGVFRTIVIIVVIIVP